MRKMILWAGCLCLMLAGGASAQIAVSLSLDQTQYLRNESLPIRVRITNLAGRNLKIGESQDWLTFTMETPDGKTINPLGSIRAGGDFELESAATITKSIDLGDAYDLSVPGRFKVTALARFPALQLEVPSNQVSFDIVNGTRLWEQTCGVPATDGKSDPTYIKYALLQTTELKNIKLFVRVSDPEETRYAKVVYLGRVVSFSTPDKQIDRKSMLHVLFQVGPRSTDYVIMNPQGEISKRETYEFVGARPRLTTSEDGVVAVRGGQLKQPPLRLPAGIPAPSPTNANAVPK